MSTYVNYKPALELLGLTGDITPDLVKTAYRKLCSQYHPDRGGSTEMMQAINNAYELLKDYTGSIDTQIDPESTDYSESLNAAINAILDLEGLVIEICGCYAYVWGDTKPVKETIKEAGFTWWSRKKCWGFSPAPKKGKKRFYGKSTPMDNIRAGYGSTTIRTTGRTKIA